MIKALSFLTAVLLLSCAAPRYSYYFDHDQRSAPRENPAARAVNPLKVNPEMMVASSETTTVLTDAVVTPANGKTANHDRKTTIELMKEQNAIEHEAVVKEENRATVPPAKGTDRDLKLAAIFGAVGAVALVVGGSPVNVIGGIALLVGMVFFVRWLVRR